MKPTPTPCAKIKFLSEEEARTELFRIINTPHKPWKKAEKKPCRFYKCPHCVDTPTWHLTSNTTIYTY